MNEDDFIAWHEKCIKFEVTNSQNKFKTIFSNNENILALHLKTLTIC